jgi:hypothetical protein
MIKKAAAKSKKAADVIKVPFTKGKLTALAKKPAGSAPRTLALRMLLAMRNKEVIKYDSNAGHNVKDVGYSKGGTPAGLARVHRYKQNAGIVSKGKERKAGEAEMDADLKSFQKGAEKDAKKAAKKNAKGKVATKTVKAVVKGKGAEKVKVTKKGKKTEADESELIGSIIFGHAEPINGLTHIAAIAEELDQEVLDAIEEAKKKKNGLLKTPSAGPAPKQPKNCGPGTKNEAYQGDTGLTEGARLASKAVKQLLG